MTPVKTSQTVKTSRELAHTEIAKYKDTASLILGGRVLKSHQTDFPLLTNLAKTYLCISAISVPSEQVFSTAGDVVRSEHNVLSPEHVDQLFFVLFFCFFEKNHSKKKTGGHT